MITIIVINDRQLTIKLQLHFACIPILQISNKLFLYYYLLDIT